jgi:hypothetical protein
MDDKFAVLFNYLYYSKMRKTWKQPIEFDLPNIVVSFIIIYHDLPNIVVSFIIIYYPHLKWSWFWFTQYSCKFYHYLLSIRFFPQSCSKSNMTTSRTDFPQSCSKSNMTTSRTDFPQSCSKSNMTTSRTDFPQSCSKSNMTTSRTDSPCLVEFVLLDLFFLCNVS